MEERFAANKEATEQEVIDSLRQARPDILGTSKNATGDSDSQAPLRYSCTYQSLRANLHNKKMQKDYSIVFLSSGITLQRTGTLLRAIYISASRLVSSSAL